MRRELGKLVRRRFGELLHSKLPQFQEVKGELPSGMFKVYGWAIAPEMKAYVVLHISARFDEFTIEAAWSRKARFPRQLDLMFPRDIPRSRIPADSPVGGEFRIRLPFLFTDRDEWWEVIPRPTVEQILEHQQLQIETGQIIETPIEVGLERIEPLVNDAVEKIVQYGVPWLIDACKRECGKH